MPETKDGDNAKKRFPPNYKPEETNVKKALFVSQQDPVIEGWVAEISICDIRLTAFDSELTTPGHVFTAEFILLGRTVPSSLATRGPQ